MGCAGGWVYADSQNKLHGVVYNEERENKSNGVLVGGEKTERAELKEKKLLKYTKQRRK